MKIRAAFLVLVAASCSRETVIVGEGIVLVEDASGTERVSDPRISVRLVDDALAPPVPRPDARDGSFRIEVKPGDRVLRVSLGTIGVNLPVHAKAGKTTDVGDVEIPMPRSAPAISEGVRGLVALELLVPDCPTCEGGKVLRIVEPGSILKISSETARHETRTAFDGTYSIALSPGTWRIERPYEEPIPFEVTPNAVTTVDFLSGKKR